MADAPNNNENQDKPSRIKRAARFMFDIPTWIGASAWTGVFAWIANLISDILAGVIKVSKAQNTESFDEAMKRQNVTEQDLQKQLALYTKSSWFFLVMSILAIFYLVHIWVGSLFFSKIVGIIVVLLCLIQAFRFSFWSFQIKQRRLGCTIKQWFNWLMRGQA